MISDQDKVQISIEFRLSFDLVFEMMVAVPFHLLQQLRIVHKVMHVARSVGERLLVETLRSMEITPYVRQKARVVAEGLRLGRLNGQSPTVEAFGSIRV